MTIFDYAKLGKQEKQALVDAAQLVEQYVDGNTTVSVYAFDNFFVEVTSFKGEIDFIPFERGYALAS